MPEGRDPKVAVVGATGAVGNQLLELIASRGLAASELRLFAGESGSSETVKVGDDEVPVESLENASALAGFDIAFLAVPEGFAAEIVSADPGPILIDLSAANRPPSEDVPILAPGLTARERIGQLAGNKVFGTPHPAAHVIATLIKALTPAPNLVAATLMLSASAGGKGVVAKVVQQTADLLSARLDLEEDETQRGFNAQMREHERAMAATIAAQTAELIGSETQLALQVITIPVLYGSGIAIDIALQRNGEPIVDAIRSAPGVLLVEADEPLGVIDAIGQEAILAQAEVRPGGLALWCVFDNTRMAALDALWIAETLTKSAARLT